MERDLVAGVSVEDDACAEVRAEELDRMRSSFQIPETLFGLRTRDKRDKRDKMSKIDPLPLWYSDSDTNAMR